MESIFHVVLKFEVQGVVFHDGFDVVSFEMVILAKKGGGVELAI